MRAEDPRVRHGREGIAATRLPEQFLRFAAVGAMTTAVQYAMLWLGVAVFAAPAALASAAGYALGVVLSYFLNYLVTFRSDRSHRAAIPRHFAVFGIGRCINTGLMTLLVHGWGWNLWLSQVIATGLASSGTLPAAAGGHFDRAVDSRAVVRPAVVRRRSIGNPF